MQFDSRVLTEWPQPELKALYDPNNKYRNGLVLAAIVALCYFVPSHYMFFEPAPVPRMFVDEITPLVPVWIWPYVSYYFFLVISYLIVRDPRNGDQLMYAYLTSAVIGGIAFMLFPTSIDRARYPLPEVESLSVSLLATIRSLDKSVNCLPSMHIAMTTIAVGSFMRESKKLGIIGLVWGIFIGYSTMATKQHYLWDVLGGFALGLTVVAFFARCRFVRSR